MNRYGQLRKLDALLGLPPRTLEAFLLDLESRKAKAVNESVKEFGIRFEKNGKLVHGQPEWEELCRKAGLTSEWWMKPQEPPPCEIPDL